MKTAIVIGATGLVGNHITKKLLDDARYHKVKVFVKGLLIMSIQNLKNT